MGDHTTIPGASNLQTNEDGARQLKAATRAAWALGDYHRFAKATVWELFGARLSWLGLSRGSYVERAGTPHAYCELFKRTFGPVVAIYNGLADQPQRTAALDRDLLEFATGANQVPPGGPAEYPYEYLLVVARKHPA